MMCEICGRPQEFKEHKFNENTFLGEEFKAWVYMCNCSDYMLSAIVFIRENDIQFNKNEKDTLFELIRQKVAILKGFNCITHPDDNYYDIAISEWNRILRKFSNEKIEKKDIDFEVERIEKAIWKLLYNIKYNTN